MKLAIFIINYQTPELTIDCVNSLLKNKTNDNYHIFVIDNASKDNSMQKLQTAFKSNKQITLEHSDTNLGFAGGNNYLYKKYFNENFDYCLLLNSDTLVEVDFVSQLSDKLKQLKPDVFSPKIVNPDGSIQPNTGQLPTFKYILPWISGLDDIFRTLRVHVPSYQESYQKYYKGNKKPGWVSGTAMVISAKVLNKIGLFDDKIFMYGEDVEYCFRARLYGFKVWWSDTASVTHYGGASSKEKSKDNQLLGEMNGLIFIYRKYQSKWQLGILKLLIYTFSFLRMFVFFVLKRKVQAKAYAKILKNLS